MRILLIGGNGFIGSPLTEELRDLGHQLAVLHRKPDARPERDDIHFIQGDRNRLRQSRERIGEFAPDVVVDLILSSGEQARELVATVRGISPRILAISSMDVYRAWGVLLGVEPGALEPLPITEDSALRTVRQIYAPEKVRALQSMVSWLDDSYDKIAVEEAVMSSADPAGTILRLPMVYGPGDQFHRFSPVVKRVRDGRHAIILSDDYARWRAPRGFVSNVAHAIAMASVSERASGRVYNVCEEPCLPELEWQERITQAMEWQGRIVVLPRERTPKHLLPPGNAAQQVVVSSERIRTELGYKETVTLHEALRRTIAWEEQNPPETLDPEQFDYAVEDLALASAA